MLDAISFPIEIIGTIAFAVSGATVAIDHHMDVLGVCVLGITTAVGGGVIRDVILGNTPPQAFIQPIYLVIATVVSLLLFIPKLRVLFQNPSSVFDQLLLVMDSLGLGVFTVVGINTARHSFDNIFLLIFVGTVTGVGGGVLRDLLAGSVPYILTKHFYCLAAIIGALVTCLLWDVIGAMGAMIIGVCTIFTLRILAAHNHWELPKA